MKQPPKQPTPEELAHAAGQKTIVTVLLAVQKPAMVIGKLASILSMPYHFLNGLTLTEDNTTASLVNLWITIHWYLILISLTVQLVNRL